MSIKNTVLIIGGTSGIGSALTRSIHAQGKKVIATGRRQELLSSLATELPGLETSCFDFSDLSTLPSHTSDLMKRHPDIDTVIINAGIQSFALFTESTSSSTPEAIAKEVNTNLTAPIVMCQLLVPYFLKSKKQCSIILISSGLAFVPIPFFPVYCPTKAAIHAFAIALRSQLSETNIDVTEVFPPYVNTGLDLDHKDKVEEKFGGPGHGPKPMPLDTFTMQLMEKLDMVEEGKPVREVPIGQFPEKACEAWRKAFGPFLGSFGVSG